MRMQATSHRSTVSRGPGLAGCWQPNTLVTLLSRMAAPYIIESAWCSLTVTELRLIQFLHWFRRRSRAHPKKESGALQPSPANDHVGCWISIYAWLDADQRFTARSKIGMRCGTQLITPLYYIIFGRLTFAIIWKSWTILSATNALTKRRYARNWNPVAVPHANA